MSYISKMKQEIQKDMVICDNLIEKGYAKEKEFSHIIGKYKISYPNFSDGFKNYVKVVGGTEPNEIENVKILKSKLEILLIEIEKTTNYEPNNSRSQTINFNVSNNNTNSNINNINFNITIDEVRENIKDNTYISDKEKKELLEKLDDIEKLQKSKESKQKKWNKAKEILKFIIDKGADMAIMYIPQILNALQ